MNKFLRRIVTGIDKDGRAIFECDDVPGVSTFTLEDECPGYNNVEFWQTEQATPSITDKYSSNKSYDFNIPPGIARFGSMRLPPLRKLIVHRESKGENVDLTTFGMHKTDTIDFLVLLAGEVTLILENGEEKTLKPGDV